MAPNLPARFYVDDISDDNNIVTEDVITENVTEDLTDEARLAYNNHREEVINRIVHAMMFLQYYANRMNDHEHPPGPGELAVLAYEYEHINTPATQEEIEFYRITEDEVSERFDMQRR